MYVMSFCGRLVGMFFFFFNDTATTEIYTLSLHDALPIWSPPWSTSSTPRTARHVPRHRRRSEEHTSELQSPCNLVCRLLLEKKKHGSLSRRRSRPERWRRLLPSCPRTG